MTIKPLNSLPLLLHGVMSQGTIFVSQLGVVVLTSHKLELNDLGKYTVAIGLVGILNFVLPSGINTAIQNLRKKEKTGESDDLLMGLILLPFFLFEFFLGAILLRIISNNDVIEVEPKLFFSCLAISNLALINGFLYTILRLQERTKASLYTESICSFFIFCTILIALWVQPNLQNFLLSSILSQSISLVFNLIVVLQKSKLWELSICPSDYKSKLRKILLFSYKTSGIALLSFFFSQLPIFVFGHQSQLSLAAEYSRSILISTIPLTILFTIYSRLYYLPLLNIPRIRLIFYFDHSEHNILFVICFVRTDYSDLTRSSLAFFFEDDFSSSNRCSFSVYFFHIFDAPGISQQISIFGCSYRNSGSTFSIECLCLFEWFTEH
jgi:hypothetical protein